MSTTVTKTRTNYFDVKDKKAFEELVNNMVTNDGKAFMFENSRGEVGFAADGEIFGMNPKDMENPGLNPEPDELETEMIHQIQALIKPGQACIITSISYENLKYITGSAYVITKYHSAVLDLNNAALEMARTMLNDDTYSPDMAY